MNFQKHEKYIRRCIELAERGIGNVSPNPLVGSVIVFNDKIIGEGYHRKYGEAHAEVNAINSVKNKDLLKVSTLYVSLEPCAHIGKTPACADLIVTLGIPKVVIGSVDPYFKVDGKGISKLKEATIDIMSGILKDECDFLNRRFFTFHLKKRPYIILKWAESGDGFIDRDRTYTNNDRPEWITNEYCRTLVHKWRTEEDAIMVGKNTVILDNPRLTSRNWYGHNPVRVVIDKMCELPCSYKIFDDMATTIIFNSKQDRKKYNLEYIKIDFSDKILTQILQILHEKGIQSIIVEGGTRTLNEFILRNLWDEARIFVGNNNFISGVKAPAFKGVYDSVSQFGDSTLKVIYNKN